MTKGWYDPWDPEWDPDFERGYGFNWGLLLAIGACVLFWAAVVVGCSYMIGG